MGVLSSQIEKVNNFHSLTPVDSISISSAEKQLGLQFAPDYKEYLMHFGAATFDGKELTGVCKSERLSVVMATERAREFYPQFPKNLYVVEELGFDHVITAQESSGKVYSYGPGDSAEKIAESLQDYLFPAGESK